MVDASQAKAAPSQPRYDRIIGVFGLRFEVGSTPDPETRQHPDFSDYDKVVKVMGSIPGYSQGRIKIISGGSKGVERLVEQWCKECSVPFERVRPDTVENKENPFDVRNTIIISESTEIMILWDGKQKDLDKIAQMAVVFGRKVTYIPIHK